MNRNAVTAHTVEDNIRRATDYEFSHPWLGAGATQMGMIPESFDHGDNAHCQLFCGLRLVQSHVSPNFLQTCLRQWRPDNLYRHRDSLSWFFPQAHFGGGSSWSVPQDKSQAFMSSCLI